MNSSSDHLEISIDDLIEKNGIWFEKYSRKPFTGCAVDYHDNGQLFARVKLKNGKLHGLHEEYYDYDGQLKSKGNYKEGKQEGLRE